MSERLFELPNPTLTTADLNLMLHPQAVYRLRFRAIRSRGRIPTTNEGSRFARYRKLVRWELP